MADSIKLVSIRPMTVNDWREMSPEFSMDGLDISLSGDERTSEEEDQTIAEILEDCDYSIFQVNIFGKIYTVYHGFPGDNPHGIFMLKEYEWYVFGEAVPLEIKPNEPWDVYPKGTPVNPVFGQFMKWYRDITEDMTDYEDFCPLRTEN